MVNQDALALVKKVNKEFGEGAVILASDIEITHRFPSGSLSLDVALGGGWPANQWVEIYGRESHGKTAITFKTIAANQRRDPEFTTLWIAAEHYDRDQAEALGVDSDRVIVVPTQEMEFAYQQMLDFAGSKSVDCVVLDSYPALVPNEEAGKDMDESVMALGARLTGKFCRKAGSVTKRNLAGGDRPFLGIIINQQRDKIGGFAPHGIPQTTPGGNAKNYFFYVRVEVRRDEYITENRAGQGKVKVGQTIKATTVKNKSAPPQQIAVVDFYFRDAPSLSFYRGEYDTVKEIILMGILFGVIDRAGAYFSFGEDRWQGKQAMLEAIRVDLDLQDDISAKVKEVAASPDLLNQIRDEDVEKAQTAGERRVSVGR